MAGVHRRGGRRDSFAGVRRGCFDGKPDDGSLVTGRPDRGAGGDECPGRDSGSSRDDCTRGDAGRCPDDGSGRDRGIFSSAFDDGPGP